MAGFLRERRGREGGRRRSQERQGLAEWLRRQLALPEDGLPIGVDTAPPGGWSMSGEGGAVR